MLKNWNVGKTLNKEFAFKDFNEAFDFVKQVVKVAQQLDHHPDIHIHSFNKVKISLFTHSQNKITQKDNEFATILDKIKE